MCLHNVLNIMRPKSDYKRRKRGVQNGEDTEKKVEKEDMTPQWQSS